MARRKAAEVDQGADEKPRPNSTAEDTAECFLELTELKASIARLGQKTAVTIARYENMGVDVEAVRECMKLEKKEDAPDWIKRILSAAAVLRIIPVAQESGGQMTLMPGLKVAAADQKTQDRLAIARAHTDGYNTGRHGGSADDNKHKPGTEVYVAWGNGCLDGQADRAARKGESPAVRAPAADTGREATKAPETALERDEAAYRSQRGRVVPLMPADPA